MAPNCTFGSQHDHTSGNFRPPPPRKRKHINSNTSKNKEVYQIVEKKLLRGMHARSWHAIQILKSYHAQALLPCPGRDYHAQAECLINQFTRNIARSTRALSFLWAPKTHAIVWSRRARTST